MSPWAAATVYHRPLRSGELVYFLLPPLRLPTRRAPAARRHRSTASLVRWQADFAVWAPHLKVAIAPDGTGARTASAVASAAAGDDASDSDADSDDWEKLLDADIILAAPTFPLSVSNRATLERRKRYICVVWDTRYREEGADATNGYVKQGGRLPRNTSASSAASVKKKKMTGAFANQADEAARRPLRRRRRPQQPRQRRRPPRRKLRRSAVKPKRKPSQPRLQRPRRPRRPRLSTVRGGRRTAPPLSRWFSLLRP